MCGSKVNHTSIGFGICDDEMNNSYVFASSVNQNNSYHITQNFDGVGNFYGY